MGVGIGKKWHLTTFQAPAVPRVNGLNQGWPQMDTDCGGGPPGGHYYDAPGPCWARKDKYPSR